MMMMTDDGGGAGCGGHGIIINDSGTISNYMYSPCSLTDSGDILLYFDHENQSIGFSLFHLTDTIKHFKHVSVKMLMIDTEL